MPKRLSKGENIRDMNVLPDQTVDLANGEAISKNIPKESQKNPAAVYLGRLGGLKSAKARMEKLTPDQRKQIAQKAARVRWGKQH